MRIIETEACIAEGAAHLIAVEPHFAEAIRLSGPPPLRRREPGFAALLTILVGQQVSVAAAASIWAKVQAAGATTPEAIGRLDEDALRALGLSRPKVRYAKAMAEAVKDGSLRLEACATAPVEDAMKMLMAVTGIGRWTAEIYLMFCIGRADVFAPGDLALQEAARILFELEDRPTAKQLEAMAEAWAPWRGVAARALWSYYRYAKGREGVTG